MKCEYQLSKLAVLDIENIYKYTLEKWSIYQADKYYEEIFSTIEAICNNSKIGVSIKEVKKDHRMKLVKSHLIIYKEKDQIIFIDRILHQRMNIDENMNE